MGISSKVFRKFSRGALPESLKWSFSRLFESSEVGIIIDPSDRSTLFQDHTGLNPVTAPGQPVGLVLDKSRGLALGSQLVTPQSEGFTQLPTQFVTFGLTVSFTGGILRGTVTSDGNSSHFSVTIPTVAGRTYAINYVGSSNFGVQAASWLNTNQSNSIFNASGDFSRTVRVVASSTTITLRFYPRSSAGTTVNQFAGDFVEFSTFSVRELAGNHGTQVTSASRPTYGVIPKHGIRRNLHVNTSTFTSGFFQAGSGSNGLLTYTTETIPGIGPCSVMQYEKLVADGNRGPQLNITLPLNKYVTHSFFLRVLSGSPPGQIRHSTTPTYGSAFINSLFSGVPNGTWVRVDTGTIASTQWNTFTISISNIWINSLSAGTTIQIGAIQCEIHDDPLGQPATAYQRIGTNGFDVTEADVPTCHYLQFDGVNDFLVTQNVNFTGTDKATISAGVRKFSDGNFGVICELTSNSNTTDGSFMLGHSEISISDRQTYTAHTRGTVGRRREVFRDYPAPESAVLTSMHDNANGSVMMRRNRVLLTPSTITGTTSPGNYSNDVLNIGRRVTTAHFLNGQLFGLVVRGVQSSPAEIAQAEKLVSKNTSVVQL
jgi:hypothetical protein